MSRTIRIGRRRHAVPAPQRPLRSHRSMSRDGGMRDVELDDGAPWAGDDAAPARGNPNPGRPEAGSAGPSGDGVGAPPRFRRRWLLAGALVLLLAAVAVVDVIGARDRAAHLAAVVGVLEPVDSSLRERWIQPGGWQHPAVHGPDLMVSLFNDRGDALRLVATDIVTGEQRWDVALPEGIFEAGVACRALGADGEVSTHIACRLDVPAAAGAEFPAYGPRSEARLVVLDAQTGETVGDRSLDHGFGTVETLGSDILVTTVLADGRVRVTREEPSTGRVRWSVQSEQPLPGAGSGPGPDAPETDVAHGVIAVSGPMAMALSEEGEVLGEWPVEAQAAAGPVELTVLADGRFVVGTPKVQADVPYGTVSTSDARDGFPIDGPVLELDVDDGSASDLLLTTSEGAGEIVALDARTGEPRWSAAATPTSGALLLDHRLITTVGSDLVALDTRTGTRLWTAANGPQAEHDLLTDGDVVLVPTLDDRRRSSRRSTSLTDVFSGPQRAPRRS